MTSAENSYPVLGWLRRGPSAEALAQLAGQAEPLTHELLDSLPQSATTRHVRCLLVIADLFGISPSTAETWAKYANDSWTRYLVPRAITGTAPAWLPCYTGQLAAPGPGGM
ncbi:hypothetical protein [Streptomyces agglomeratus]|uniref:hypothetical protein n=1 Tax=Streptomyces agglomeratus TaxID=285458 RepID=UPI00114CF111|nr:hypothetical protein [Streptomyces agglomeratus]